MGSNCLILLQETQQCMVKFGLRWARQLRHRLLGQENPGVVELIFPKTSQFFQTELMLFKSTLALDCSYCLHNTGPCWAKAEADYRAEQRPFGHGRHDRYAHPVWDPKRRPVAVHPFGLRSKFTEVKSNEEYIVFERSLFLENWTETWKTRIWSPNNENMLQHSGPLRTCM